MIFSVLIANYNNTRFLQTAINSVLGQTFQHWEIIIVDDASTDGFEELIPHLVTDKRVKVFRNYKNFGCGYTKRKCIEKGTGHIMGFLDPDDALTPDALQIMIDAHATKPLCSIIHSTHYICDALLTVNRVAAYPKALPPETPYLLLSDGSIHHFASFKKEAYYTTRGLSPFNKKAVDQDLYYTLEEAGEVFFINKPLYYYRIHPGSISTFGKEWETTIYHYTVIEEACKRRIQKLQPQNKKAEYLKKKYRERYYKIRIFHSYRKKQWLSFLSSSLIFPFAGGMNNIISYCKKLPKGGFALIKRSFNYDHEIK